MEIEVGFAVACFDLDPTTTTTWTSQTSPYTTGLRIHTQCLEQTLNLLIEKVSF